MNTNKNMNNIKPDKCERRENNQYKIIKIGTRICEYIHIQLIGHPVASSIFIFRLHYNITNVIIKPLEK